MADWIREHIIYILLGMIAVPFLIPYLSPEKWGCASTPKYSYNESKGPGMQDPQIKAAQKIQYKQPQDAIAILEKILASPENETQATAARELLPQMLLTWLQQCATGTNTLQAESLYQRLISHYTTNTAAISAYHSLRQMYSQQLETAIRSNDNATVDSLFNKITRGCFHREPPFVATSNVAPDPYVLEKYQEFKIRLWLQQQGSTPAVSQTLRQAVFIWPDDNVMNHPVVTILRNTTNWNSTTFINIADTLEKDGFWPGTIPFLTLALWKLNSEPWTSVSREYTDKEKKIQKIEERIARSLVQLASAIHDSKPPVITTINPADIDQSISLLRSPDARRTVLECRIAILTDQYLKESAPFLKTPLQACLSPEHQNREILNTSYNKMLKLDHRLTSELIPTATARHQILLDQAQVDPWPDLPESTRQIILKQLKDSKPATSRPSAEETRNQLRTLLHTKAVLPFLERHNEILATREQLEIRMALYPLSSQDNENSNQREEGCTRLRPILRNPQDPAARTQIETIVKELLQRNQKNGQYESLRDLATFYVTEIKPISRDQAFHQDVLAMLLLTARQLAKQEPMQKLFTQCVITTGFPETTEGKNAQASAMKAAFALAGGQTDTEDGKLLPPSGLPGYSVACVDNATEYSILSFYDGPEQFFVLCRPRQRGSIVLRDGEYKVVVITTDSDILPYHARLGFPSVFRIAKYVVKTSGSTARSWPGPFSAHGDYSLLRMPAQAGPFTIDPKTGMVLPK